MYLVTVRCPSFDYVYTVGVIGLFESLDDANDAIEEYILEHTDAEGKHDAFKFRIRKYDE